MPPAGGRARRRWRRRRRRVASSIGARARWWRVVVSLVEVVVKSAGALHFFAVNRLFDEHGSLTRGHTLKASSVAGVAARRAAPRSCAPRPLLLQKARFCAPRLPRLLASAGCVAPRRDGAVLTLVYARIRVALAFSCVSLHRLATAACFLRHSRQHPCSPYYNLRWPYLCATPTTQFRAEERRAPLERRALGARALATASSSEAPLPRQLDIALAAAGAGSACALLCALEPYAGVPLRAPPLAASACILFASTDGPPDPLAVLGGTAAVATAAVALVGLFGPEREAARARGRRRARVLQGEFILLPARRRARRCSSTGTNCSFTPWSYVLFPCVAGNAFLWCLAALLAIPRTELRAFLMTRQWQAGFRDTGQERAYFLEAFDARWDRGADSLSDALCDISGVCDLSDEEREIMLRAASSATAGAARLDFSEFSEAAYTQLFSSTQTRNKRRLRLRTLRSLWRRDPE